MDRNQLTSKQQGTVLITVVMMVALAALIATDIGYRQKMDIKRTAALLSRDQAFHYLLGAEEIANLALVEDLKDDNNRSDPVIKDSLYETWAEEKAPFPVAGGFIQGKITDLQARFNINSIFASDAKVQTEQKARLASLMVGLGIPSEENSDVTPAILVERLVDWIDSDQEPTGFDGREDLDYLNADPPYRVANQLMWDISELMLVEGFTPKDIKQLEPYISFLPPDVPINLNTAEDRILALVSGLNAMELAEKRKPNGSDNVDKEGGYGKLEDLLIDNYKAEAPTTSQDEDGNPIPPDPNEEKGAPVGNFSIHSEYFLLEAKAVINQKTVLMEAILYRETIEAGSSNSNIKIKTISRKLVDPLKRV